MSAIRSTADTCEPQGHQCRPQPRDTADHLGTCEPCGPPKDLGGPCGLQCGGKASERWHHAFGNRHRHKLVRVRDPFLRRPFSITWPKVAGTGNPASGPVAPQPKTNAMIERDQPSVALGICLLPAPSAHALIRLSTSSRSQVPLEPPIEKYRTASQSLTV
jgi:hypothetical protein